MLVDLLLLVCMEFFAECIWLVCMGVIENQFELWKEVLNVFNRFGDNKFYFLDSDNGFVCWIMSYRLGSLVLSEDAFQDIN